VNSGTKQEGHAGTRGASATVILIATGFSEMSFR
jgi:hypothetical protein